MNFNKFTEKEKEYVQEFICNNTRMVYREKKLYDHIGKEAYSVNTFFNWECKVLPWSDGKIRAIYNIGLKNKTIGQVYNSS